jgi:hypothetical protein
MSRSILIVALLSCVAFSQPGEFRGNIHVFKSADIDSALLVGKRPISANLHTIAGWDSANDTVKQMSLDSLTSGPVAHGVTPGTMPKAATDSTWENSPIYKSDTTLNVFKYDSIVPTDTLYDGFNRTVNPLDSGWTNCAGFAGTFYTSSGSANVTGQAVSIHSGVFGNDQYSWVNGGASGGQGFGVGVRASTANCGDSGYYFIVTVGSIGRLYKRYGGSFHAIDSTSGTTASPVYVWMTVVGDTIKCYCYGIDISNPVITRYDTSFRSGAPAIYGTGATAINAWKGVGIGGVQYVYTDSIFKVNGKVLIENTPTTTTGTRVMIKNDEPDNEIRQTLASTLDVDSARASGSVDGYSASNSTVTSTSYFTAPDNDTLKRISVSNTLSSLGLSDSLITKKVRVGSATNNTAIDSTGILLTGSATEWDDEKIVATAFDYIGTGDPEIISWELGTFDNIVRIYQSGDRAYFTCQFSHGRKNDSDIYAHIHWTPHVRGNEENGATVNWILGKTWSSIGEAFPAMDTIWLNDTCTGVDDAHLMSRDVLISGFGKKTSSVLTGYVERADGDTWIGTTAAQSPGFLEIDFHYEVDKLGSDDR